MRRNRIPISIFLLSCLANLVSGVDRPNVIFILMDDLGYSDVSCYGAEKVGTPNIDRMAAEGLKFTDFHTAASICSPSRAAFLTGAYPQRAGLYMGINQNREAHWFLGLNPDEITIAEQFKKQGYVTALVGKWHLGKEEAFSYYRQGFDHYYGALDNMGHNAAFYDEREVIYDSTPLDQLTRLYTERMVKHIGDFTDVLPSLVELAGGELPADSHFDGKSFLGQLLGQENAPARDWVFIGHGGNGMVRADKFSLDGTGQLYDLRRNRYEPERVDKRQFTEVHLSYYKMLSSAMDSLENPFIKRIGERKK